MMHIHAYMYLLGQELDLKLKEVEQPDAYFIHDLMFPVYSPTLPSTSTTLQGQLYQQQDSDATTKKRKQIHDNYLKHSSVSSTLDDGKSRPAIDVYQLMEETEAKYDVALQGLLSASHMVQSLKKKSYVSLRHHRHQDHKRFKLSRSSDEAIPSLKSLKTVADKPQVTSPQSAPIQTSLADFVHQSKVIDLAGDDDSDDDSDACSESSSRIKHKVTSAEDDDLSSASSDSEVVVDPHNGCHIIVATVKDAQDRHDLLSSIQPAYIVLYDADVEVIRMIETYQAGLEKPLKVYLLMYGE